MRTTVASLFGLTLLLLTSALWAASKESVSFSADVTRFQADRKTSTTGKLFVGPDGVRSESIHEGTAITLIHKLAQKTVLTLLPGQKSYTE
ncbi:MAG: hypothetical protein HQL94_08110, partial [Magnetococcales bacterium]|nr:hypothetical protein [Magnetococcales bacterium]